MTTELKLTRISPDAALKHPSESLYISNRVTNTPQILVPMGDREIVIPDTGLPFDLSVQGAKKDILMSANFRKLESGGMVRILDPEACEKLRANPEYASEIEAVTRRVMNTPDNIRTADEGDEVTITFNAGPRQSEGEQVAAAKRQRDSDLERVNPAVLGFVGQLTTTVQDSKITKHTEDDAISRVRGMGSLRQHDVDYMLRTLPAELPKVRDYVARLSAAAKKS